MKNGKNKDQNGTERWYLNGVRHREGGPAITWASGTTIWYLNGECHRMDGPAVEFISGQKNGGFTESLLIAKIKKSLNDLLN